jgi:hypothetical protein
MLIATRQLTLTKGGTVETVTVRIFAPREQARGWQCQFEIAWPDGPVQGAAEGVDAVQALELTLKLIGAELYNSQAHRDGTLAWERPGGGYGFPVARAIRDMLVGDDKTFDG